MHDGAKKLEASRNACDELVRTVEDVERHVGEAAEDSLHQTEKIGLVHETVLGMGVVALENRANTEVFATAFSKLRDQVKKIRAFSRELAGLTERRANERFPARPKEKFFPESNPARRPGPSGEYRDPSYPSPITAGIF